MKRPVANYYPNTDSLFLNLRDGDAVETVEVADQVLIGYNADGVAVTIEIEGHASEILKEFVEHIKGTGQTRKARSA